MCIFIGLAVKEKQPAHELLMGYCIYDNSNGTLINAVPKRYRWLWITDGHCSCDFYTATVDPEEEIAKIRKKYSKPKYRKKGWNTRRVEDKIQGIKRKSLNNGLSRPLYEKLKNYVKSHSECFFFAGWVSGNPDDENFSIMGTENFEILNDSSKPSKIRENVLYKMI